MTDFEREDLDLKAIMGDKFIDETNPIYIQPEEKEETFTFAERKTPTKTIKASPSWHPKKERNWMDDLKDCAKSALIFGGLNILIWYWMATDLMAETIALPSMIVCACLMGLGIGKVMGGKK